MQKLIVGISLIVAPFGLLGAGIVLAVLGSNQGWIPAHVLMLAGLFLYVSVVIGVRQLLGFPKAQWAVLADGGATPALLGILFSVGQITIDIAEGLLASTPVEMHQMAGRIRANPGMEYAINW